jgi:hypothetical protein
LEDKGIADFVTQVENLNKQFGDIPNKIETTIEIDIVANGLAAIDKLKEIIPDFNVNTFTLGKTPEEKAGIKSPLSDIYPGMIAGHGAHADGGILSRPHIGLVAEDGAEAIIPLSAKRRERGLSLWEKAGEILGVRPYADGGIVGASSDSAAVSGDTAGAGYVSVSVENISPTIEVHVDGNADERQIIAAVKNALPDITDEIARRIALTLQQVYANMMLESR